MEESLQPAAARRLTPCSVTGAARRAIRWSDVTCGGTHVGSGEAPPDGRPSLSRCMATDPSHCTMTLLP